MPTPYRPRHRRPRAAHSVSDRLFLIMLTVALLSAGLCLGGLLSNPFSLSG